MKLKTLLFTLLTLSILLPNAQAQPEKAWKTIFNGKTFKGWSIIGGNGKVAIEDNAFVLHMTANTKEHTFTRTNKKYKNFIFEVDCKRDPGFFYGILFRAQDAPDTADVRLFGYQVKVDHDPKRNWTGGIFDDFGTSWNWLYTLKEDQRAQKAVKPAGEWDHYRIEAIGKHIKVWVNDIPTSNMINAKYGKGYLAFKIHFLGNEPDKEQATAWIKNVRVITRNARKYARPMDIPAKEVVLDTLPKT